MNYNEIMAQIMSYHGVRSVELSQPGPTHINAHVVGNDGCALPTPQAEAIRDLITNELPVHVHFTVSGPAEKERYCTCQAVYTWAHGYAGISPGPGCAIHGKRFKAAKPDELSAAAGKLYDKLERAAEEPKSTICPCGITRGDCEYHR